jgi:hypothetical protein
MLFVHRALGVDRREVSLHCRIDSTAGTVAGTQAAIRSPRPLIFHVKDHRRASTRRAIATQAADDQFLGDSIMTSIIK